MVSSINFSKSIQKKRVIYKPTVGIVYDYLITYSLNALLIVLPTLILLARIKIGPLLFFILDSAFITWATLNMFFLRALIEIKGKDVDFNRTLIISILEDYFQDLKIDNKEQLIIINVKPTGFIYWGRIITVLLDQDAVYLNIQSLVRGEGISFFHGFNNYLKCRQIKKLFLIALSK